jgi:hypothetical protein
LNNPKVFFSLSDCCGYPVWMGANERKSLRS